MKSGRKSRDWIRALTGAVCCVVFAGALTAGDCLGATKEIALPGSSPKAGEKLIFDVFWMGIFVGTGQLQVTRIDDENGRRLVRVEGVARTNEFLSKIYPVEDRVESYFDAETFGSVSFRKTLSEGRYRADEKTIFDPRRGLGRYESFKNGSKKVFRAQSGVKDIVSAFYWFRSRPVKVGDTLTIPVSSEEKDYDVRMRMLSRQPKELRGGRIYDTLLVEPQTSLKGVFYKRGKVWVYFTADSRRLPVWISFKTPFGPIVGVLRNPLEINQLSSSSGAESYRSPPAE